MIYPVFFVFAGSFLNNDELRQAGLLPIPKAFPLDLHRTVLEGLRPAIGVTLVRAGWYVGLALVASVLGGYVFSRLRFPGKNTVFLFFLASLTVPPLVIILPNYIMIARFPLAGGNNISGVGGSGLIDTMPALLIYGMVDAFAIFLVKQSFDMIPREYEDAARVEGAGLVTILWRIYVPMLKPALMTVIVIVFVTIWNDYFWPRLIIHSNRALTPVALAAGGATRGGITSGLLASATLVTLPPLALFLLLQRYFVGGIAAVRT